MSFQYSAIGDNTPENREHLEKVGYGEIDKLSCPCLSLITNNSGAFFASPMSISNRHNIINCIGNPQLFKAVSAMSDDSDELQYFTDGASWLKIPIGYDLASFLYTDWDGDCGLDNINKWHKATLSELQAHFQRV